MPASIASFADHYRSSDYAAFPQEHRVSGSRQLSVLRVQQDTHEFSDPPVPEVIICAARKSNMTFSWNIGDGWTREQRVRSGSLHVLPANCHADIRAVGPQDMLFLALPLADLESLFSMTSVSAEDLAAGNTDYFHDPASVALLDDLWAETRGDGPASILRVDSLILALAARLLRRPEHARTLQSASALDRVTMKRVTEYIDEHLSSGISLSALSRIAGTSRFSFARAFKAQTGTSPYRYVLARRCARACVLLRASDQSLVDIALACGFSSQSHMTDAFRKVMNVTPGRYRSGLQ